MTTEILGLIKMKVEDMMSFLFNHLKGHKLSI